MNAPVDIAALSAAHPDHWSKATAIRTLTLDAVKAANSGHSGMPMGMADVATVLFEKHLKFDASAPNWPDRDRFILSAGHGSMLLYSLLYLTGYKDMTLEEIKNFRQWGARTAGHPEYGHASGLKPQPARWVRAFPMRSALPWPKKCSARITGARRWITIPM